MGFIPGLCAIVKNFILDKFLLNYVLFVYMCNQMMDTAKIRR